MYTVEPPNNGHHWDKLLRPLLGGVLHITVEVYNILQLHLLQNYWNTIQAQLLLYSLDIINLNAHVHDEFVKYTCIIQKRGPNLEPLDLPLCFTHCPLLEVKLHSILHLGHLNLSIIQYREVSAK